MKIIKSWRKIDSVKRIELIMAAIRTFIAIAMLTFVLTTWTLA